MTDDAETVMDVLLEAQEQSGEPINMTRALYADDFSDLSYEDWANPMKLTGGRVCLRVKDEDISEPAYLCWHRDDTFRMQVGNGLFKDLVRPSWLVEKMSRESITIEPVLREDTPFGGSNNE